jgi:short-subunit dehydrogenase
MPTPTAARPLALVTGASSGIGRCLALQLAQRGFDLVLTAVDAPLEAAAQDARARGAWVDAVRGDLTRRADVEALAARAIATERPLAFLALNAGQAAGGDFVREASLEDSLAVVDLDVRSTVHLAKLLVPRMVEQGSGRVLVTSSIAATSPGPGNVVYNAAKAFDQSFALALREELEGTGVTVTALMPGPADTPIWRRANLERSPVGRGPKDDPADVARQGIDAALAGEERVIAASLASKLAGRASRVLPDAVKAKAHGLVARR